MMLLGGGCNKDGGAAGSGQGGRGGGGGGGHGVLAVADMSHNR